MAALLVQKVVRGTLPVAVPQCGFLVLGALRMIGGTPCQCATPMEMTSNSQDGKLPETNSGGRQGSMRPNMMRMKKMIIICSFIINHLSKATHLLHYP